MSIISFRPAMSLAVEEDGTGKPISALRLKPTGATRRKLADHRLVFRLRPDGFQIYGQHNPEAGDARLAPITVRTPLVFGAWLIEPDFLDRYHPDLDAAGGASLHLANLNADGSVRASGTVSRGDAVETADGVRIVGRRSNAAADRPAHHRSLRSRARCRQRAGEGPRQLDQRQRGARSLGRSRDGLHAGAATLRRAAIEHLRRRRARRSRRVRRDRAGGGAAARPQSRGRPPLRCAVPTTKLTLLRGPSGKPFSTD
jgi:hypothetical protein